MINSFLKYLEYERRYSKHTITSYQNDLHQVQIFVKKNFQTEDLQEANHGILRAWLVELSEEEVVILKENAPTVVVADGASLVDVLVETELATSKREARTFIEGGAVQVGGDKVESVDTVVQKDEMGALFLLKRGKKNVCLVEVG